MTDLFFCIIFAALPVKLISCHKSNFLTPIAEMLGLRPKAGPKMAVLLTMSQMMAWIQPRQGSDHVNRNLYSVFLRALIRHASVFQESHYFPYLYPTTSAKGYLVPD